MNSSKLPGNVSVLALVVLSPRKPVTPEQTGMVGHLTSHWDLGILLQGGRAEVAGHLGNFSVLRMNGKRVHRRTRLSLLDAFFSVCYAWSCHSRPAAMRGDSNMLWWGKGKSCTKDICLSCANSEFLKVISMWNLQFLLVFVKPDWYLPDVPQNTVWEMVRCQTKTWSMRPQQWGALDRRPHALVACCLMWLLIVSPFEINCVIPQ